MTVILMNKMRNDITINVKVPENWNVEKYLTINGYHPSIWAVWGIIG